eukprot:TRINITY_DN23461_c0_g1_i1.p1 TRINITY_DN23461_c0_g1~~TRINITY_DN23461_c0_g1_i1.p1  ORF type:complete len:271 (+),score=89.95 TRINITY_DN23461_c0_g1_i1:92-814(+)
MDAAEAACLYVAFLAVVPFLVVSLDPALREKFVRRLAVASLLLVLLTPCALGIPYAHAAAGTVIAAAISMDLMSVARCLSGGVLLAAWLLWVALPVWWCWRHDRPDDITFAMATVLLSDAYQFIGGAVLGLGRWTPKPFAASPRKSLGGYAFALVFATATAAVLFPAYGGASCGAVIVVGFAGDVAASLLKRAAGVKDFGGTLGAHGGALDRFDGANAAVALYCTAAALSRAVSPSGLPL